MIQLSSFSDSDLCSFSKLCLRSLFFQRQRSFFYFRHKDTKNLLISQICVIFAIAMNIIKTPIEGLLVIEPKVFCDSRGFFSETYNEERYRQAGIDVRFVQDNMSQSQYGVVRGLHFQKGEFAQAKLVHCIEGSVLDVAVDLREGSPTFSQWFAVELSAENHRQFFIPRGFAHGFSVLSESALFSYKCDNLYHPEAEGGILLSDPDLAIDWRIPADRMILSEKDRKHPLFKQWIVES